jgi:hypothetical protein
MAVVLAGVLMDFLVMLGVGDTWLRLELVEVDIFVDCACDSLVAI